MRENGEGWTSHVRVNCDWRRKEGTGGAVVREAEGSRIYFGIVPEAFVHIKIAFTLQNVVLTISQQARRIISIDFKTNAFKTKK
jgi:hypothetical protein